MNEKIKDEIISLCKEYKKVGIVSYYVAVADKIEDKYGVCYSSEAIRGIVRTYRKKHNLDENFNKIEINEDQKNMDRLKSVDINKDGSISTTMDIVLDENEPITPELLLKKHGYDPAKFKVVSSRNSIRDVFAKGNKHVLYSSNISVKPISEFNFTADNIKKMFDGIKNVKPKLNPSNSCSNYEKNGKQLIVPIADLHFNLLATTLTSKEKYDVEIAKATFLKAIYDIKIRVEGMKFESILFPFGNDGLNSDVNHTTTKGTPQDDDIDWESAVLEFTNMLVEGIEILRTIAPVECVLVSSNHDYHTMFGIANALRLVYNHEESNVHVDYSPFPRKYYVFGNTLIMLTHDMKPDMVNNIIQAEARELLSQTNNTVVFLAHLHSEYVVDKFGTDVRRLSTLSPSSKWSTQQGYTSRRKAQAFIVDEELGITDVLYIF